MLIKIVLNLPGELDPPIHQEIEQALKQKGINQLYTHQAEAINGLRNNSQHIIVATSTARYLLFLYIIRSKHVHIYRVKV